MKVRFLLDENLSPRLAAAIQRVEPALDVLRIGEPEAPALHTQDPEILRFAEQSQRVLITQDKVSMSAHEAAHRAAGGHHWGVFRTRPRASIADLRDAILLLWGASEAEEWIDHFDWIP